jgi:hypothetical protein
MMWGFYLWPRYDWTLSDRRQALARRLCEVVEPALRVVRESADVVRAVTTSSALLVELLMRRR